MRVSDMIRIGVISLSYFPETILYQTGKSGM